MANIFNKLKNKLRLHNRFLNTGHNEISPIVTIQEGKLRGAVKKLYDGSAYYSFKGIPYAEPPVGKLRLKDPIPHKSWSGVLDAIEHGPYCPQIDLQGKLKVGSENCLFLNVYTRSLLTDSKLPVIVFIHGGAFISGSGDSFLYGPKFLLKHDVILVTLNYRLATLGFISLETPEVPGNAGLKDQVVALRWVQRNISQFGGDPNNVTIFGESSGGASVTFHLLSPMTDGLFHKVIAQSGVCLLDWSLSKDAKKRAFMLGKILGREAKTTDELLEVLQGVEPMELVKLTLKASNDSEKYRGLPIYYSPVIEKEFDNEIFLNEEPIKLLRSDKIKKVPTIIGYNSSEGHFVANMFKSNIDVFNKFPSYFVPRELVDKVSKETMYEFGNRIKKFYWSERDISLNDNDIINKITSDLHILVGTYRFADMYSAINESVFMYRFNCVTELNHVKFVLGITEYGGACHSDQLFYTFNNSMNKEHYEKHERLRELVDMVTKIWTDFAKTGNPTPDDSLGVRWLPYDASEKRYLNIEPRLTMGGHAESDRLQFWRELYEEAGVDF